MTRIILNYLKECLIDLKVYSSKNVDMFFKLFFQLFDILKIKICSS